MQITAETSGHAVILNLKGELTEDSLQAFGQAVQEHMHGQDQVVDIVLNLEMVPFIDSAALEALLDLRDRLAGNLGALWLARPDENVRQILAITRLDTALEVVDDVQEAVRTAGV